MNTDNITLNKRTPIIFCATNIKMFDEVRDKLLQQNFENVHKAENIPSVIDLMPDNKKCIVVIGSNIPTDQYFLKEPKRFDVLATKLKAINSLCNLILFHSEKHSSYFERVDILLNASVHQSCFILIKQIKDFAKLN